MKRKKNILEEAADKVLEQYDNREFLEKIRAERGPSIIAAQKERKMYRRRTWCYTAVATLAVAMITILCCYYAFNIPVDNSDENYYELEVNSYEKVSLDELNSLLNGISINEIDKASIIKLKLKNTQEYAAYILDYKFNNQIKKMRIVFDIHSQWDYKPIDFTIYDSTIEQQGHTIYYGEVKTVENQINKFIVKAYLQIDDIKIHFEYEESSFEEKSDFLNTLAMFVG
ncbi:MAG: hypothetical protein OSJ74_01105 [Clostridia bacterium]|nr:hypothetical protein [Clostridia bacterium]